MAATKGVGRMDDACNEPVDVGLNMPGHCWRPDNGSGICNVHEAARKRGAARREEAARRHLMRRNSRVRETREVAGD